MNTQQTRKAFTNALGNLWPWLGIGLLLVAATLAISNISRPEVRDPAAGLSSQPQSVPDAAAQGVAGYIEAHSGPSVQTVPDAAEQGVAGYLQAHGTGLIITDPAQKSVMDYLRAHGIEVP